MTRKVRPGTFVAAISLAAVAVTLGVQAVSPALPALQRELGLNSAEIGWFTTAYVLPGVLLTVPLGILGDSLDRRTLFCVALAVYGFAALAQITSTNYVFLLAMRALQGTCFAAAMPLTITVVGQAFKRSERIRALATRNAVLTGSEVVLPIGGALLVGISWRVPFVVQTATIPLAIWCYAILDDNQSGSGRKRYARALFSVLRSQPGMFAVLLTAFSRYSFKLAMLAYLPVLLVNEEGASITQAGIVVSGSALVAAFTAMKVPAAVRRFRPSSAVIAAVATAAVATAAFSIVPGWRWALGVGVFLGVGDGVLSVLQDTYAIHTAQAHVAAGMVSVSQTARNLGKLLAPLLMTAIVSVSSVDLAFVVVGALGVMLLPLFVPLRNMDAELQAPDVEVEAAQATEMEAHARYE